MLDFKPWDVSENTQTTGRKPAAFQSERLYEAAGTIYEYGFAFIEAPTGSGKTDIGKHLGVAPGFGQNSSDVFPPRLVAVTEGQVLRGQEECVNLLLEGYVKTKAQGAHQASGAKGQLSGVLGKAIGNIAALTHWDLRPERTVSLPGPLTTEGANTGRGQTILMHPYLVSSPCQLLNILPTKGASFSTHLGLQ
ncbi:hypothetical protein [Parasedimentitalea psychrophila]|uniref:hypothetical protein n=1 Tax=Parasedimentitalea psychrophila TaxID=2997337 RepID=UPI0022EB11D4|nr:hypothetical protein [Parasedimentitalea psychrophila]